jgi:PEP-CTERM motif
MKKLLLTTALAVLGFTTAANATTWTVWSSGTLGSTTGSAIGTMGSFGVTYSGENQCLNCFASNWSPASTWQGGSVANAPPDNSGIQLFGSFGATDTVTFSSPVTDPVLAIVSLGQPGITASFNFTASEPFVLLGGGPSSTWAGQALTRVGDIVYGAEGNGLVQFMGAFSSLTWTNPVFEDYYAVTVGSVPEPSTWAMMALGFAGLGFVGYRKAKVARTALAA